MLTAIGSLIGAGLGVGVAGLFVGYGTKIKDAPAAFFGSMIAGALVGGVIIARLI